MVTTLVFSAQFYQAVKRKSVTLTNLAPAFFGETGARRESCLTLKFGAKMQITITTIQIQFLGARHMNLAINRTRYIWATYNCGKPPKLYMKVGQQQLNGL